MSNRSLHIISLDNPFPPNYGGMIDVFYKIKALHAVGLEIYLHCYVTSIPTEYSELRAITEHVYFYKRKNKLSSFFKANPFSVDSRFSKKLIQNINQNDFPILFEGLQTTAILNQLTIKSRNLYLRLHNNEEKYYDGISKSEKNGLKKWVYSLESKKYKAYQKHIFQQFKSVFTLSESENTEVNSVSGNGIYIPVFHGNEEVKEHTQFGKFALYHGDLRIADNLKAVDFLISVFKDLPEFKFVIASKSGKKFVEAKIKNSPSISFVEANQQSDLNELFAETHLHVLYSFQQSGTKLKVINALFNGRYCLINSNMIDDERIKELCIVAENKLDFKENIIKIMNKPFLPGQHRENVLKEVLNDVNNASLLAKYIVNGDGS
jgi:hypothetical protein